MVSPDVEMSETTQPTLSRAHPTTLLTGVRLALAFSAFLVSFSLIALEQTVITTALPKIASYFDAAPNIAWFASVYFLPQAAFTLFFGRVLSIARTKPVFLFSVGIFELGSLLCATAPSVPVLVFGRIVAGFGASGLWASIMGAIAQVTILEQRPIFLGLFGALFGVASIVGTLAGGIFADHLSWRTCFYISLPLGQISMLAVISFLPAQPPLVLGKSHFKSWLNFDWVGTFLSLATIITLFLALQWGGNTKPWGDPAVIVCLVLSALLLAAFLFWEHRKGLAALLPLGMLRRRNILGVFLESAFIQVAFVSFMTYLPPLYKVRGHSVTKSRIDVLPFLFSGVIAMLAAGIIVSMKRPAWPFLLFSPLVAVLGFGILFTTNLESGPGPLVVSQILVGVGLGAAAQNTLFTAQAEYNNDKAFVPLVTSLITFTQYLGGVIGLTTSGTVLTSQLCKPLAQHAPQLAVDAVLSNVEEIFTLPPDQIKSVQRVYITAINRVMIVGATFAVLSSISALLITRKRLRRESTSAA